MGSMAIILSGAASGPNKFRPPGAQHLSRRGNPFDMNYVHRAGPAHVERMIITMNTVPSPPNAFD